MKLEIDAAALRGTLSKCLNVLRIIIECDSTSTPLITFCWIFLNMLR